MRNNIRNTLKDNSNFILLSVLLTILISYVIHSYLIKNTYLWMIKALRLTSNNFFLSTIFLKCFSPRKMTRLRLRALKDSNSAIYIHHLLWWGNKLNYFLMYSLTLKCFYLKNTEIHVVYNLYIHKYRKFVE